MSGQRRLRVGGIVLSTLLALALLTGAAYPGGGSARSVTAGSAGASTEQRAGAAALPPYTATVSTIGPKLRERMQYSHRRGCPLALRNLRYLQMSYVGFGGRARTGEMVVRKAQARPVVRVFGRLYDARFRIRRMRLVDAYGGSDDRSMAANNTSAYNCRRTINGDRWSEHSYGRAIDINPIQNPYVSGSFVSPEEGRPYAWIDRSVDSPRRTGVIRFGHAVVKAFRAAGWSWGGHWRSSKDWQHFSASGL